MNILEKKQIQLGYIPLLDCVAVLWAKQRGFFEEFGLDVTLVKEASWASLRDRLAFGVLDAAHCLSAMLPAATIGTDQIGIPFQTSLILSVNRAFISLSQKLCFDWQITKYDSPEHSAKKIVNALQNKHLVNLAHVFKHSIHHYCLREWLALADEQIAHSTKLLTCPPPYMVEAISKHTIDGFCVGEPWNIQAEIEGFGHIIAESKDIIPEVADKVLAVTKEWAQTNPHTLLAITNAICKAQEELKHLTSMEEVWKMLEQYNIIRFHCSELIHVNEFHKIQNIIRTFVDHTQPKVTDFEWIIAQMCKWDELKLEKTQITQIANECIFSP